MIIIQNDLWRSDCIAGVRIMEDSDEIELWQVSGECVTYSYDSETEAATSYKELCAQWVKDLRHMG
jgi:hypothetical protein